MVEHKWIKASLIAFKKVMEKNKIPFWLEYGTQLGAVREGRLISWDLDGDVGIWLKDVQKLKDAEADFRANNMYVAFQPDHPYLNYKTGEKTWLSVVDIYTFDLVYHKNDFWTVRIENGQLRDVRSPATYYKYFRNVRLFDKLFPIPVGAEKALEFVYGKEWRTPINRASISVQFGKRTPEQFNKGGRTHHKKLKDL